MIIRSKSITLASFIAIATFASLSSAQEVRRYQPTRSTISPYLNLTRSNTGGLPNYYSLVRPLQNQQNFNQQAASIQNQQRITLGRLEQDLQFGKSGPATGKGSWFMNPGQRQTFMSTEKYYPTVNLRNGRR